MRGAVPLAAFPHPRVRIICTKCDRQGDYSTARLQARYGDIGMPDLLTRLSADCPRRIANRILDLCGAVYAPESRL